MNVTISFKEAAFGTTKTINITRYENCDTCHGSGAAAGTSPETCPHCRGTGQVRVNMGFITTQRTCDNCRGTGKIIKQPCSKCRGAGQVRVSKKIDVNIPGGIDSGQRISVRGQGNAGKNGGPAGDIILTINVTPDPVFKRQGDNIIVEEPITFAEAALGAEIDVPSLDGTLKYTIPEGTQNGTSFRIKDRGMTRLGTNRRGDLIVKVFVEIPKNLSAKQKELIKAFDESVSEKNHKEKKSFLIKLKTILKTNC